MCVFMPCTRCQPSFHMSPVPGGNNTAAAAATAVLDPALMAYDAYGLHHAADKPGREGHSISLMGRQDAEAAVKELHRKFRDKNTLLAWAVNPDMRVAFDHWRGEAQGRDSSGLCGGLGREELVCVILKWEGGEERQKEEEERQQHQQQCSVSHRYHRCIAVKSSQLTKTLSYACCCCLLLPVVCVASACLQSSQVCG